MDEFEEQTPEELEAHYGPEGPVEAARTWFSLVVRDRDLRAAWPKTDPNLRLVMTQGWCWANRSHPLLKTLEGAGLARELAREPPVITRFGREPPVITRFGRSSKRRNPLNSRRLGAGKALRIGA
jgi:hypothetical protein